MGLGETQVRWASRSFCAEATKKQMLEGRRRSIGAGPVVWVETEIDDGRGAGTPFSRRAPRRFGLDSEQSTHRTCRARRQVLGIRASERGSGKAPALRRVRARRCPF